MSNTEIIEKLIAILLSVCLLVNAYAIKRQTKSWLVPGSLCSLFWFLFTFFPLVFLYSIPVSFKGQLFITIAVLLFSWTFKFFNWQTAYNKNRYKEPLYTLYALNKIFIFLCISVLISIIATIIHLGYTGFSLKSFIVNPIASANLYSQLRYTQSIDETYFNFLSLIFSYVSTLLGGLLFFSKKVKTNKLLLLVFSFLPAIIVMLTQSAKGAFFLCLFLFLGCFYVSWHFSKQKVQFSKKHILYALASSVSLFLIFTFSFLSRGLKLSDSSFLFFKDLKRLFSYYTMAHMYSFSEWMQSYLGSNTTISYDTSYYHYGYYTFNFVTRYLFPDKEYIRGIYNEFYSYNGIIETNVYTIFRGLIMDFGILGSLFVCFLVGFIVHKIYVMFLISKSPFLTHVIMIGFIAFLGQSFLASLLTWTVVPVAFLCFTALLYISRRDILK